jgi:hypothetical protein
MTIEEFEKIKFAKFKPDTKQEIKETTQLTTPISSTKTSEISESLQKQIKKIRTMSDSQWNVYRKNK